MKSNQIFYHFDLFSRLFPEPKLVFIVRDPRDRAVSLWFHKQRTEEAFRQSPEDFSQWCLEAAASWRDSMSRVLSSLSRDGDLGDRTLVVRYEDLLGDFHGAVGGFFELLGVSCDDGTLQGCEKAVSFAALSGGRRPGDEDEESFFRKGIAGDWKNHMDGELNAAFVRAAGDVMRTLGYS